MFKNIVTILIKKLKPIVADEYLIGKRFILAPSVLSLLMKNVKEVHKFV